MEALSSSARTAAEAAHKPEDQAPGGPTACGLLRSGDLAAPVDSFWLKAKEEAQLRAMRPRDLPVEEPGHGEGLLALCDVGAGARHDRA